MPLHGRDEHRVRKREEVVVEVAGDYDRPLDEGGVLLQQRGFDDRPASEFSGRAFGLRADRLHALVESGHDLSLVPERRHVPAGIVEHDVARMVESVPAGRAPGGHSEDLRLDDRRAVHQHHPVHGADEFGVAVRPPHPARHRQPGQRPLDHHGQQRGERRARCRGSVAEPRAVPGLDPHQPVHLDPHRSRKAERRLRRLVVLVERAGERRTAPLHVAVRLGAGHAGDEDREPPRGREGRRGAMGQPRRVELGRKLGRERLGERAQRLRRQLLGADLHQQVVHVRHLSNVAPGGSCRSRPRRHRHRRRRLRIAGPAFLDSPLSVPLDGLPSRALPIESGRPRSLALVYPVAVAPPVRGNPSASREAW